MITRNQEVKRTKTDQVQWREIAAMIASNQPVDYITITYGEKACLHQRYWPWVSIEASEDPADFFFPVKDERVAVELTSAMSEENVDRMIAQVILCGAKNVMVLDPWRTKAYIIAGGSDMKELNYSKALNRLMHYRKKFYDYIPADDEEHEIMIDLAHKGLKELIQMSKEYAEV